MKTILCLLLLAPIALFAQSDSIPFKKCNTITVEFNGSADSVFRAVGANLLDHGYLIEKKDSELFTILTEEKRASGIMAWYKVAVRIVGNKAIFTGLLRLQGFEGWDKVRYQGSGKSAFMQSWAAMEGLSASVNGSKIYTIQ
jgi:hypothetical protein